MRFPAIGVVCISLVALAACRTGGKSASPSPAAAPAVAITAADLPGNWGLASYRAEADRGRTETEARNACRNPYRIAAGTNGGAMMHLADQATPTELFLKTDSSGRTFIGPPGATSVRQDRLVVSFENGVMVTEWLDAGVRERYGTMVFVRCA